jgi:DNA-directed RNA polymerase specialized sigma24 family protein
MHNLWVDTARGAREDPSDQVAELVEAQWCADDYTADAAVVAERAATRDDLREALTHLPTIYRTTVAG